MKTTPKFSAVVLCLVCANSALAAVHYVDLNSTNATPPYTNSATAATNIQDAVDAAVAGDEIVVTNGVYSSGEHTSSDYTTGGPETNRVVVWSRITLHSVNGPQFTIIDGGHSVRCVYLASSAVLSGFTLTNGSITGDGAGVRCQSQSALVTNCVIVSNLAFGTPFGEPAHGGGASGGTLENCSLSNNSTYSGRNSITFGGGAWDATLKGCILSNNSAYFGGGVSGCTLHDCSLSGNVGRYGGAADNSTLTSSYLVGNWVWGYGNVGAFGGWGGGAFGCMLEDCTLTGNSASEEGGSFGGFGGGAYDCMLNNCTLSGNSSRGWSRASGGGAFLSTLNNCIVYFNASVNGANYDQASAVNNCCTTPLPMYGIGNIASDPLFVDTNGWADLRLQPISPCINAGNNEYVDADKDLNGNPRINRGTVDIGAYEFQANTRYVDVNSHGPAPPYTNWTAAATNIQDVVDTAVAGDEIVVTNGIYALGSRFFPVPGGVEGARVVVDKPLSVRSVNGPQFTVIDGGGSIRCAYLTNLAKLCGFTVTNGLVKGSGAGILCESQSALISNCIVVGNSAYNDFVGSWFSPSGGGVLGGTLCDCTLSNNRAVSGNQDVLYGFGGGAYGSVLNHCRLIGNAAGQAGGGADSATLNNCTLTGNLAHAGGGAADSTLNNSLVISNSANARGASGGGAAGCTLNNCTVAGNSSLVDNGGASDCILNNCILYFNTALRELNYDSSRSVLNFCCTTPFPTNGVGSIASDPLLVDTNGWSNLRLQSNSPCINAGRNAFAPAPVDLDGNQRIKGGTVDIGAYEFQSPASTISYAWLQQYGLPTDGSADFADADADGMNNWQECGCGTNPTNALSALRLLSRTISGKDFIVSWQSVAGVNYFLERSLSLAPPAFASIATNIQGQVGTTSFVDTNAIGSGPFFYRVSVGD